MIPRPREELVTTNPSTHPLTIGDTLTQFAIGTTLTPTATSNNQPLTPQQLKKPLTATPEGLSWLAMDNKALKTLNPSPLFVILPIQALFATTPSNLGMRLHTGKFLSKISVTVALTMKAGTPTILAMNVILTTQPSHAITDLNHLLPLHLKHL